MLLFAVFELLDIEQDGHARYGVFQLPQHIEFCHQLLFGRQEFVDGRIQQSDGHRPRGHDLENSLEVLALDRQQLVQRFLPVFSAFRNDHFYNHG